MARGYDLAPVGVQISLGVCGIDVIEVRLLVGLCPVQIRHVLAGSALTEPPTLRISQVPDQAQKREVRRGTARCFSRATVKPEHLVSKVSRW
jgi:hypothetical protein